MNTKPFAAFLALYTPYQSQAFATEFSSPLTWFYEKPASHFPTPQLPMGQLLLPPPWPWAAALLGKAVAWPP